MPADLIQETSSRKSVPLGFTERTNPDGSKYYVPQVDAGTVSGGGGGGSGVDKEIHVTTYRVKTAFTGGAVGQMVSAIRAFDVTPATIYQVGATFWLNETTGTPIANAPPLANLEQPQVISNGLTNAEFVAGMAAIAKETTAIAISQLLAEIRNNGATESTLAAIGVSLAPVPNVTTQSYVNGFVLKAGPGVLYGLGGYNNKETEQYLQFHDATGVPADNAVPKLFVKVEGDGAFFFDFGSRGRSFVNGIVVCNSSTGPVKTGGSADCWFDAQVK